MARCGRRFAPAILPLLGAVLAAALMGAASGQETDPDGNPLGLPACKHALEAPSGTQLGVAPVILQAEKTCTNAPEPSDKPKPSETPRPREASPSQTASPSHSSEEEYLLTGQWHGYTNEPTGAHIVTSPGFNIHDRPGEPTGHIELNVKVKRIGQRSVYVTIGIYSLDITKPPPPGAYASCQIYRLTPEHPKPGNANKVGHSEGGGRGIAFCQVD